MRHRAAGQALVELALVAPLLILLAMAVWDGGSALREQVILQQAARDAPHVAAAAHSQTPLSTSVVCGAVSASAADLPSVGCNSTNITATSQSVTVRLSYDARSNGKH